MPIRTVAPDSPEYIRVIDNVSDMNGRIPEGSVGKVISRGHGSGRIQPKLVIADVVGYGEKIFNTGNTKEITEKEYFVGALRGKSVQ